MTEPTTTISVRGEARQVVPPDHAVIATFVRVRSPRKEVALEQAGTAQAAVLDALRERGGQALTVDTVDAPLTWSTTSYSAERVRVLDRNKQEHVRAWRVHVPITVTVRELDRLDELGASLTQIAPLHLMHVRWRVDPRNPAWPVVRAAAITDAVDKARDYATALGGTISSLAAVADEGLLGSSERYGMPVSAVFEQSTAGAGDGRGPSLDPVPQEISAVIEARFEAAVAAL